MTQLYVWFVILGFGSVAAALATGFRHDPGAPSLHYAYNAALFAAYMLVHTIMMMPWFKKLVSKDPAGSPSERRLYMIVAVVTWIGLYLAHWPVPGPTLVLPEWLAYLGACAFMMSFLAFVEGSTFESIKSFAGVPGYGQTHGAAAQTPLQTEGSYASVRHPMYRGAVLMGLTSLLIHPNAAQLAWAMVMGVSFIAFIPFEERQLIAGRGDEYREYMRRTPYRIARGIW
jgi:protein-S-isoprenylcysteine O-methyltransferase Ste14